SAAGVDNPCAGYCDRPGCREDNRAAAASSRRSAPILAVGVAATGSAAAAAALKCSGLLGVSGKAARIDRRCGTGVAREIVLQTVTAAGVVAATAAAAAGVRNADAGRGSPAGALAAAA